MLRRRPPCQTACKPRGPQPHFSGGQLLPPKALIKLNRFGHLINLVLLIRRITYVWPTRRNRKLLRSALDPVEQRIETRGHRCFISLHGVSAALALDRDLVLEQICYRST